MRRVAFLPKRPASLSLISIANLLNVSDAELFRKILVNVSGESKQYKSFAALLCRRY